MTLAKSSRAIVWAYWLSWGRQSIQVVSTFLLAFLVGPEEFGVVALAQIYVGSLELALQQGFSAAIVQQHPLRHAHATSTFWCMTTSGALLCVIGIALALAYGGGAGSSRQITAAAAALALALPALAASIVPTALLMRWMRTRDLARCNLTAMVCSAVCGVTFAVAGKGWWALVAMHVVYHYTNATAVLMSVRWRPSLSWKWSAMRELLAFSSGNFSARLANYVVGQADAIVIGLLAGPAAVGVYRMAARTVEVCTDALAAPLQFVSFPELSRVRHSPDRLADTFLRYVELATQVTWPALAVIALSGFDVAGVLGREWAGIEVPLPPLALAGAAAVTTLFVTTGLQATGRPGLLGLIVGAQGLLGVATYTAVAPLLVMLVPAHQAGIVAACKGGVLIVTWIPCGTWFIRSKLKITGARMATSLYPAALMTCAAAGGVTGADGVASMLGLGAVAALLGKAVAGVLVAAAVGVAVSDHVRAAVLQKVTDLRGVVLES